MRFSLLVLVLVAVAQVSAASRLMKQAPRVWSGDGDNKQIAWSDGCMWDSTDGETLTEGQGELDGNGHAVADTACGDACHANSKCTHFLYGNGGGCFLFSFKHQPNVLSTTGAMCGFIEGRSYIQVHVSDQTTLLNTDCTPDAMIDAVTCSDGEAGFCKGSHECGDVKLNYESTTNNKNERHEMTELIKDAFNKAMKTDQCDTVCHGGGTGFTPEICEEVCYNEVPQQILASLWVSTLTPAQGGDVIVTLEKSHGDGFCGSSELAVVGGIVSSAGAISEALAPAGLLVTGIDVLCAAFGG